MTALHVRVHVRALLKWEPKQGNETKNKQKENHQKKVVAPLWHSVIGRKAGNQSILLVGRQISSLKRKGINIKGRMIDAVSLSPRTAVILLDLVRNE
jgi:hypothetical protein